MLLGRSSVAFKFRHLIRTPGYYLESTEQILSKALVTENVIVKSFSVLEKNRNCHAVTDSCAKIINFRTCFGSGADATRQSAVESVEDEFDKSNKNVIEGLGDEIEESIYNEIIKEKPELEPKLRAIVLEVSLLRIRGCKVPDNITKEKWIELMDVETASQKIKRLGFWFLNEKKKLNDKMGKKKKKMTYSLDHNLHYKYGLSGLNILMKIYDKSINKLLNYKLLGALMYSQTVVFDCSYDNYMSRINQSNCGLQLFYAFSANRNHAAPFHVSLCNVNRDSFSIKHFTKCMVGYCDETLPWDIHEKSYVDLYPRDKIVYLSPHAKNTLLDYKHDDIYVIGSFVDKGTSHQLSLAKARENQVKVAKLPLDNYLTWKKGTKSLPINIVLRILLDRRLYGWETALKNIPPRCLRGNF